jgi:hypothetical protein
MIVREHDEHLINRIANSAEVRPFICYHDQEMDWWPAIRACCVLSNGDDAVGVFEPTGEREFQVHTRALDAAKEMVSYMMPEHADRIWGATPVNNRAARWFNRQMGAEVVGHDTYDVEGEVELFELRSVQ